MGDDLCGLYTAWALVSYLSVYMVSTPQPLYNTVHYNMFLDISWIRVGHQMLSKTDFPTLRLPVPGLVQFRVT